MKDLLETQQKLTELKGESLAMQAMLISILRAIPMQQLEATLQEFDQEAEIARVTLLNSPRAGEHVLHGFDACAQQMSSRVHLPGRLQNMQP